MRDTNNKERCFIFHILGQYYFCIGIGYKNQGLKLPPLYYCAQPFKDW